MGEERDLVARLDKGPVVCAEGYLFELERRGYLQAGPFVPIAVLEEPEAVSQLHWEFVRAGSDVVVALTYYAQPAALARIGKAEMFESLNREALRIAARVASKSGALLAGDISNTNIYDPADQNTHKAVRRIFEKQVIWAAEAGVDYVIGETFSWLGEAMIALEVIREAGKVAVITLALPESDVSREGLPPEECCRRLADAGAQVVGLNCFRGPQTMLPFVERVRSAVSCHVAALPVAYRTTTTEPTMQSLTDPYYPRTPGGRPFPTALDPFACNRYEAADFAECAVALGVRYLGLCCGGAPHQIRSMAEALGRRPPASRYSPEVEGAGAAGVAIHYA